jgi:leader peptidase (prepilin peptidase)/N-methyltransferase
VVRPRSRCGACHTQIGVFDNIPIVSYLLLRGRCRACGAAISARYPFVEALTGLAALATFVVYGPTLHAIVLFAFLCALIVVSMIDLDHQIIPNVISVPGILVGFLAALLVGQPSWRAAAGLALGGGVWSCPSRTIV